MRELIFGVGASRLGTAEPLFLPCCHSANENRSHSFQQNVQAEEVLLKTNKETD